MDMLDTTRFYDFTNEVVQSCLPAEEVRAFELYGWRHVDGELQRRDASTSSRTSPAEHRFLDGAVTGLQYILLIKGTIDLIESMVSAHRTIRDKGISVLWREKLEACGVKAELAEKIVDRFTDALRRMIDDNR